MVNPRSIAADVLYQVIYQGKSLTAVLQSNAVINRGESDRALVKDICFGSLRWHFALNQILDKLLAKPLKKKDKDVECVIRIGLYQLHYQQTADHAAVNETVNACKALKKNWSKGLVNGVLRRFIRDKEILVEGIKPHTVFPLWLIRRIKQAWPECWKDILAASNQRAPMTLRVNNRQTTVKKYIERLHAEGIIASRHPLVASAIELEKAVNVQQLPDFVTGQVSVQDASAQLAAPLLDVQPGMRVLDACAAPGGKTAHLIELTQGIRLTALDSSGSRLLKVKENLYRMGYQSDESFQDSSDQVLEIREADANDLAAWYCGRPYDRILLDVPCSALGVMRRHPDIKVLRQETDIAALVEQQKQLLEKLWQVLKQGGYLLYATCSILPEENEQQIARFLRVYHKEAEVIPIREPWGVACTYGRQILPQTNNMDGFYYCLLKKLVV